MFIILAILSLIVLLLCIALIVLSFHGELCVSTVKVELYVYELSRAICIYLIISVSRDEGSTCYSKGNNHMFSLSYEQFTIKTNLFLHV